MRKIEASIRDVVCGDGVKIVEPCNLYECYLADNVFVGPFVEIKKSNGRCADKSSIA